jgi:hypothetical protein
MPTDQPDPPAAPPAVDLSDVLVAAAHAAGFDLDTDELVILAALHTDLALRLVHAAARLAANRCARALLADAEFALRHIVVDERDQPIHEDELIDIAREADLLDHAEPALTLAVAHLCRRLHDTGLGLAWPHATKPDPDALSAPDRLAT